jgi:hypothetical protein
MNEAGARPLVEARGVSVYFVVADGVIRRLPSVWPRDTSHGTLALTTGPVR